MRVRALGNERGALVRRAGAELVHDTRQVFRQARRHAVPAVPAMQAERVFAATAHAYDKFAHEVA